MTIFWRREQSKLPLSRLAALQLPSTSKGTSNMAIAEGTYIFPRILWRLWVTIIFSFSLLVPLSSWADSDAIQPLTDIIETVSTSSKVRAENQGYGKINVRVRPLDDRLRLPLCSEPLTAFYPQGSRFTGPISVGVRCNGHNPWTIYARATVTAERAIPVLVNAIPRNTIILKSDLKMVYKPMKFGLQGIADDPDQIIGMELTRALDAGSTIKLNQLKAPKVITRGQQVILISGTEGLVVRMQGKALRDAISGERVQVTNLSSGQKIEGIANTDGTVSVP